MIRGIGLRSGIAINVITMIGIGPLVTMSLVLGKLAGPLALAGWITGAIVALCDGLVWAELSSKYPGSGGTYVYLREIFGRERWGRLLAFLFNWQFLLFAPCLLATGYIGFAQYFGYLNPAVADSKGLQDVVAVAVGILVIILLYRRITAVAAIGSAFAVVAVVTLVVVTAAGFSHAQIAQAFVLPPHASFGLGFLIGLGGALYITLYDYAGYSDAALLGDEVRNPNRTIPLSIIFSILIVAALYIMLQISVLAHGIPAGNPQFIASSVVAGSWGTGAAQAVTILILVTAFASVFGNLAGFARIPYAAAKDGEFFKPFAHLNPRGQFPDVALLVIGIAALAGCFFTLDNVIAILTAGIVLIQGVMQIVGLFLMRLRKDRAPFRMWLYPLPALVALIGWLFAFYSTGAFPIALGVGWLLIGGIAYLITAKLQWRWPFALALCVAIGAIVPLRVTAAAWPGSAVVRQNGWPVYTVGGKPFFVYGAAFFYERIPREQWEASLEQYRALGINTIDLYLIWNWHELRDGDFDFTGRTDPRRDLAGLLRLIDRDGFKVILRPGPVIRNEWRNGGYPDWLLRRPDYRMPLRDILEGRYPATATLQNTRSDDAAAEWLRNGTHLRYAARWLRTVLNALAPWRRDVIAIALDDDQGAYLNNQTWPAPHFQKYIRWLESVVRSAVGSLVPVFINTYDMKVTASSPVWAWGNWYQSTAYSIGEHDRAQLELAAGLLQTQPDVPLMFSEFQAGWLQGASEPWPRAADPANTTLALNTLLQMGAHGVVNFPVQDTLYPPGWEAPWANAFYSWDAALSVQLTHQNRWLPTYRFGEVVHGAGTLLAQMHVKADAAIAYLTSAYDPSQLTNDDIASLAQAASDAQAACRAARLTCALVDLRYEPLAGLLRYRTLIVPAGIPHRHFIGSVTQILSTYRTQGGRVAATAQAANISRPAAGGIPNAVLLLDPSERFGFLSVVNYASSPVHLSSTAIRAGHVRATLPALTVPPRDAVLIPINVPENLYVKGRPLMQVAPPALRGDVWPSAIAFENKFVRLLVSPCAGARAFIFEDKSTRHNFLTTVGGFRDVALPVAAPSARDYIANYTHPIPAGTFNRCYAHKPRLAPKGPLAIDFTYVAPELSAGNATFSRELTMTPTEPGFTVATTGGQREQLTSFATNKDTQIFSRPTAYGLYDPTLHRIALVAWDATVSLHRLERHDRDALLTLVCSAGKTAHMRYAILPAANATAAQAALSAFTKAR